MGVFHGTGRKPRSGGDAKGVSVPTRFSGEQLDAIEDAAKLDGISRSEFIWEAANAAAERRLG